MRYALLGIIQGLSEFIPVSSSGHLAIFSFLSGIEKSQVLPIIVVAHLGTLLALFCFFARDILRVSKDLIVLVQIFIVNLLTAAVFLTVTFINSDFLEQLFLSPRFIFLALLITAVLLILTRRMSRGRRDIFALNIKDAFWLGLIQGLAIVPGFSRSGLTIFTLLSRRVEPQTAFKFSFIAGIPAIFGSFLWEAKRIGYIFDNQAAGCWLAFVFSFIFGIFGLFILRRVVKRMQLHYFGYYLILVSVLGFMFVK